MNKGEAEWSINVFLESLKVCDMDWNILSMQP